MCLISKYKNENGKIPEHVSTCKRFEAFMESEWNTGIDFNKEFDRRILQDNLDFDKILEEANNMQRAYQVVTEKCMILIDSMEEGEYVMFGTPLMWSHIEYMKALLYQHELYSGNITLKIWERYLFTEFWSYLPLDFSLQYLEIRANNLKNGTRCIPSNALPVLRSDTAISRS